MPRLKPLPKQLRYLQPFRAGLDRLEPEELNENADVSALHKVILKRVEGLSSKDAAAALEADLVELKSWISTSASEDDAAHFLEAQLSVLPFLIEELGTPALEPPPKPTTKLRTQMEIPKGARARAMQHGVLKVTWNGVILFACPFTKEDVEIHMEMFGHTARPVVFGKVSGFRLHRNDHPEFMLTVPGGHVLVSLVNCELDLEQSKFENYLRTLRIVEQQQE